MDELYATILVLVVTNQRILLAADSRKSYLDKKGIREEGTLDKIYQTGDCYYAVCGFHEEEGRFSLHQYIHKHLWQFINLHEAVKHMVQDLAPALQRYFQELKLLSPALFQQLRNISAAGGEIFIVGRIGKVPTAFLIDYFVTDRDVVKVTMNTWSINILAIKDRESCFWRTIGNVPNLTVSKFSERNWALHPEAHAKEVINEGSKQFPHFVSSPINMLELSESGIHWIEKTQTAPNRVDESN